MWQYVLFQWMHIVWQPVNKLHHTIKKHSKCFFLSNRSVQQFCSCRGFVMNPIKRKKSKVSLLGILREYAENASIHGIAYIYSSTNAVEKFVWCVQSSHTWHTMKCWVRFALVLAALCCTVYVVSCDYRQWQDKPVTTSLKVITLAVDILY